MSVHVVRFGNVTFDRKARTIRVGDRNLTLRPKTFGVLDLLLERAGDVVTSDALLAAVWPSVRVSPGVLKVCIRELRELLRDDPRSPRFIETHHRAGYRFVARINRGSLVDRSRIVAHFSRLLEAMLEGRQAARALVCVGPNGAGKSTALVAMAAVARAQGVEVVGTTPPLDWVERNLRRDLRRGQGRGEERKREYPSVFDLSTGAADAAIDETDRASSLNPIERGCRPDRVRTETGSRVWLLDDVDGAPAEIAEQFLSEPATNLLIVATMRSPALSRDGSPLAIALRQRIAAGTIECIELEPFSQEEVYRYVRNTFDATDVESSIVTTLFESTAGNPRLIESLVDSLASEGVVRRDRRGRVGLAPGLGPISTIIQTSSERIARQQLAQLSSTSRHQLAIAALQGDVVDEALWRRVSGRPAAAVAAAIEEAISAGMLCAPGEQATSGMRWRWEPARLALEAALPEGEKRATHAALARALESTAGMSHDLSLLLRIARHYEGAHLPLEAAAAFGKAARAALRRWNVAEAESCAVRGLACLSQLPIDERIRLTVPLVAIHAATLLTQGQLDAASEPLRALRALAHNAKHPEVEVDALLLEFRQVGLLGRQSEADALLDKADEVAKVAQLAEVGLELSAHRASLRALFGDASAIDTMHTGVAAAVRRRRPTGISLAEQLGSHLAFAGRYRAALPYLQHAADATEDGTDPLHTGAAFFWLARCWIGLGRPGRAFQLLDDARRRWSSEENVVLPMLYMGLGSLCRSLAGSASAAQWDALAVAATQRRAVGPLLGHAQLGLAFDRIAMGEPVSAARLLDETDAHVGRQSPARFSFEIRREKALAACALALGDCDDAERHVRNLIAMAERTANARYLAEGQLLRVSTALAMQDLKSARRDLTTGELRAARLRFPLIRREAASLDYRYAVAAGDEAAANHAQRTVARVTEALRADISPEILSSILLGSWVR